MPGNVEIKTPRKTARKEPEQAQSLVAIIVFLALSALVLAGGVFIYLQSSNASAVGNTSTQSQEAAFGSFAERESVHSYTEKTGRFDHLWHEWERAYFGCTRCVNRFGDSDEDGLLNLFEFLFLTNPFNPDTNDNGVHDIDDLLQSVHPAESTRALFDIEKQHVSTYIDPEAKSKENAGRSSAISREVTVPEDARFFEFVYHFSGSRTGTDYITVFFDNELLMMLEPTAENKNQESELRSTRTEASALQERTGTLMIVFNDEGTRDDSSFFIETLHFITNDTSDES